MGAVTAFVSPLDGPERFGEEGMTEDLALQIRIDYAEERILEVGAAMA